MLCGSAATLAGLVYLWSTGASATMLAANAAALLLGLTLTLLLRPFPADGRWVFAGGIALLATALLGLSVEGAARWVPIGSVVVQPSLILLPLMIVLYLTAPSRSGGAGVIVAAVALALQPDRGMAAALLAALLAAPRRAGIVPIVTAGVASAITFLRADLLPAMPWVDGVLFSAPRAGIIPGAAVWGGIVVALLPVLLALRAPACAARGFAACWTAIVVAAALGNYPTPLVGYGASAILGYLLAAGWLPRAAAVAGDRAGATRGGEIDGGALPRLA